MSPYKQAQTAEQMANMTPLSMHRGIMAAQESHERAPRELDDRRSMAMSSQGMLVPQHQSPAEMLAVPMTSWARDSVPIGMCMVCQRRPQAPNGRGTCSLECLSQLPVVPRQQLTVLKAEDFHNDWTPSMPPPPPPVLPGTWGLPPPGLEETRNLMGTPMMINDGLMTRNETPQWRQPSSRPESEAQITLDGSVAPSRIDVQQEPRPVPTGSAPAWAQDKELVELLANSSQQERQAFFLAFKGGLPPAPEPRLARSPSWTDPEVRMEWDVADQAAPDVPRAEKENGVAYPTRREAKVMANRTPNPDLAITGSKAVWGTLSFQRSHDPVMNQAYVMHARCVTHKWKQLCWMVRARDAFAWSAKTWTRPVRWLANMHGREMSALWGHLGVASRELRGPKGPAMYR